MSTRIYIVSPKVSENGKPAERRLVRATHPSNAIRHVAEEQYHVTVAKQDDLEELLPQGIKVESIKVEQQQIPE